VFEVAAPVARVAAASRSGLGPKSGGSRPELLDRIQTNPLLCPPMYAVGGVVVLLYGLALFGLVSSWKNRPAPEPGPEPPERFAVLPLPTPPPVTPPPTKGARPTPEAKDQTKPKPKDASERKVAKTEKKRNAKKKETAVTGPSGEPKKRDATDKTDRDRSKTEIARADTAPATPPPPPSPPKLESWNGLVGVPGDCKLLADGTGLNVTLPGTLHLLSPDLNLKNAPRMMSFVEGDFVAAVKIPGRILPGTKPVGRLPFTFQGAGLLIWEDENNYLRLEKASSYSEGKLRSLVLAEYCSKGKVVSHVSRDVREGTLTLKFDRRGSEVRCSYSPDDGKTWLELKRQNVAFPNTIAVGVSASNASPKAFVARFEDFRLNGPGVKARQGY
jgi:regulation of enolase protein 1 (concanavalin A-like superfamily)